MKTPIPTTPGPEWIWRLCSILALPALLWSFSLSRERAEVQFRLTALERVTADQAQSITALSSSASDFRGEMRELRVALEYLRRDIQELKQMIAAPSDR